MYIGVTDNRQIQGVPITAQLLNAIEKNEDKKSLEQIGKNMGLKD